LSHATSIIAAAHIANYTTLFSRNTVNATTTVTPHTQQQRKGSRFCTLFQRPLAKTQARFAEKYVDVRAEVAGDKRNFWPIIVCQLFYFSE